MTRFDPDNTPPGWDREYRRLEWSLIKIDGDLFVPICDSQFGPNIYEGHYDDLRDAADMIRGDLLCGLPVRVIRIHFANGLPESVTDVTEEAVELVRDQVEEAIYNREREQ